MQTNKPSRVRVQLIEPIAGGQSKTFTIYNASLGEVSDRIAIALGCEPRISSQTKSHPKKAASA